MPGYIKPFFLGPVFDYQYMMRLRKIYLTPHDLLFSPSLSLFRKKCLLKKWRDDRTRYIFENCRDHDYLQDGEMEEVLKTVEVVKAILDAEEKIRTKIHIYSYEF